MSMRFIEQWFHLSPDNGSGAIEAAHAATLALLAVLVISRHYIKRFVEWCARG